MTSKTNQSLKNSIYYIKFNSVDKEKQCNKAEINRNRFLKKFKLMVIFLLLVFQFFYLRKNLKNEENTLQVKRKDYSNIINLANYFLIFKSKIAKFQIHRNNFSKIQNFIYIQNQIEFIYNKLKKNSKFLFTFFLKNKH